MDVYGSAPEQGPCHHALVSDLALAGSRLSGQAVRWGYRWKGGHATIWFGTKTTTDRVRLAETGSPSSKGIDRCRASAPS